MSNHSWRGGGQNGYDKFPLPKPNVIHAEYPNVKLPSRDA